MFEKGFILFEKLSEKGLKFCLKRVKKGWNFVWKGLKIALILSETGLILSENALILSENFWTVCSVSSQKSASIPCCACFHELFSKKCHFVQNSDKFRGILSENVRNFVRECFFRTKLGQKFVKYAQETLECQMNILSSVSDKWIFWSVIFLCVYAFLMVKRGWCIDLVCFHKFSLELLIL